MNDEPFDPPSRRSGHRATTIYALADTLVTEPRDPSDDIYLGRLAPFYSVAQEQLPRLICREDHSTPAIAFTHRASSCKPVEARSSLFGLASGQIMGVMSVTIDCPVLDCIPVLEDMYYGDISIDSVPLFDYFCDALQRTMSHRGSLRLSVEPERHQLLFQKVDSKPQPIETDTISRLVYRADRPARPGYSSISYPGELNRNEFTVGAVGEYVSVFAGHQGYVENCYLISALMCVGAAYKLRMLQRQLFGLQQQAQSILIQEREFLIRLDDIAEFSLHLSRLEVDLSLGVEMALDIGLQVPSLRPDAYHNSLVEAMDLTSRTAHVSRALDRLTTAVASEAASVNALQVVDDEYRRDTWSIAIALVSAVAVPLALLFGFFGINTRNVDTSDSLFSIQYWPVYAVAFGINMVAVAFFVWRRRRSPRLLRLARGVVARREQ